MRSYTHLVILMFLVGVVSSCQKEVSLKKFNKWTWKADYNGCDGNREVQMQYLGEIKQELVGISEVQLLDILGRPNKHELDERKRKRYVYYFMVGKQCIMSTASGTRALVVELDALNRVKTFSLRYDTEVDVQ